MPDQNTPKAVNETRKHTQPEEPTLDRTQPDQRAQVMDGITNAPPGSRTSPHPSHGAQDRAGSTEKPPGH